MIEIKRTNSNDPDFAKLVKELDAYLAITDGDEHDFYNQFNKLDNIKHVVILYEGEQPVACGAIKKFEKGSVEIKRMFVIPSSRNKGYASQILKNLELWARDLGFEKCILETGLRQTEAISLYHRNNYKVIPNYGPYKNMINSKCFGKILT